MGNRWSECVKLAVCTAVAIVTITVCQEIISAAREAYARARKGTCRQDDRKMQERRKSNCECQQDDAVMHFHGPKDSIPFCANSNCKLNFKDHCILRAPTVRCLDCKPKGERHDD